MVTTTLSADQIRLCDEADVAVSSWPVCPVCTGGIHLVFVQVDKAYQAAWMVDESLSALKEIERFRGNEIRVGVVHYNSASVRRALAMTENLNKADKPLSEPVYGHDPHGDFIGAAKMALDMLKEASDEHERITGRANDQPCEYVIFFASTADLFNEDEENMRKAGQMITKQGIVLMAGCPEDQTSYCIATKDMPEPKRYYSEFSDKRMKSFVLTEMDKLEDRSGILRRTIYQDLPAGLHYVELSASEPPTVTINADSSTRLSWTWPRLQRTEPHTVTYRVKPLIEGAFPISGVVTLTDKDRKTLTLPLPPKSLTVTGNCGVFTPTVPPTQTPDWTSTPTATSTPKATATPEPRRLHLPYMLNDRYP
jgi:hypothetical protein